MFRKMLVLLGVVGGMLAMAGLCSAVQVDGYAFLGGQLNHEGIKVLFQADSPSAVTDSTYSDSTGYYLIEVSPGFYDVFFSYEGFGGEEILDQNCFSSVTFADVMLYIHLSGSLSGIIETNPYIIDGNIYVQSNDSLYIEPGVVFLFDGDFYFNILGYIHADGTEEDSIKFVTNEWIEWWDGINFLSSSLDSSRLEYCFITGSNSSGINISQGNLIISHCNIYGNYNYYDGGGIRCYYSNPIILECTILENISNYNDGGGIYCDHSSPYIRNCTISGNSASGGDGIYCYYSSPILVNTVVEGNSGNGIYFSSSPNALITYGDFYNNGGSNFAGSSIPPYLGQIVTVNANGDSCDAFFNIFEDPLFVDPAIGDFHLQAESPCIDAGDPTSPLDPDNTIADIGAFYFDQGQHPEIEVSASLLDFGSVAVGTQADMPLTIYNVGDTTLVLYDIYTSEPSFSTDFNPADSLIAPGDSLLVTVFFTPAEITTYYEALTIENNDETVVVTLQGEGVGPIEVTLTPYNPPIVIPESGGSFNFNIEVENLTAAPQTFDLWTEIVLPGVGSVEIMTVTDITLPAGIGIDRDRTQQVPEFAPAGTYTYYAYVGTYPWVVENYDCFTFEKEGSDRGGSLGSPSDWLCSGEPFALGIAEINLPKTYSLYDPYPNPFNPSTNIRFELPVASWVRLAVYDISGRLVGAQRAAPLLDGWRDAGYHEVNFDGSDLASGVYIYRLEAGEFSAAGKMVLMK